MAIRFPSVRKSVTIETPAIMEAAARIMSAHSLRGQFVVFTGMSGVGKTTASSYLANEMNEHARNEVPDAFGAKLYVATDLLRSRGDILQRRVLAEFAQQVLDIQKSGDIRTLDVPALMNEIVAALRMNNVQMVFIDEAGHIPPAGLDHLATLLNFAATREQHPLTLVLVGMHDLPANIRTLPQVQRRVTEFVYFQPYDRETALNVLREVHPYFAAVDVTTSEGRELMEFLLRPEVSGGLIGHMIPLVERTIEMHKTWGIDFGLKALRVAHLLKHQDFEKGQRDVSRNWASAPKLKVASDE